jgi:excisionase family DNA binding protein
MTESDSNGQKPDATVADVARHYGVSERTVRRWLANTDIPYRRVGGAIRFSIDEVDGWAKDRSAA